MSAVISILFILGGLVFAYSAMITINKGKIPVGMFSLATIFILLAVYLGS